MKWREKRQILVLLSLALLVRSAWWIANVSVIENEGAEYARLATNWLHGIGYVGLLGGEQTLFPPLYPGLIALVTIVVGDPEVAGRLVSLAAGIALVFAMHRVTREVFGPTPGLIAAVIAALHPALVALSVAVYSESLALALLCLALYGTLQILRRPSLAHSVLTGLAFGAAYLVRQEGLVFGGAAAFLVSIAGAARGTSRWPAIRAGAAMVLATALMAAPYVAFLSIKSGAFHWEGKSHSITLINQRIRSGMSYPEAARGLGPNLELEGPSLVANQFELFQRPVRPADSLRSILSSPIPRLRALIYDVATSRLLSCPLAAGLAAVGLFFTGWWRTSLLEGVALLVFLGVQSLALLSLEYRFDRHILPVLPLFLPWVAAGAERLGHAVSRSAPSLVRIPSVAGGRLNSLVYASLAVFMLIVAYPAASDAGDLRQAGDRHLKQTGEWMRRNSVRAQPRVAAYSTVVAYYADGSLSLLPFAPEALALKYLHRNRPDFIVVRSDDVRQTPYAADWLDRGIPDRCAVPGTTVFGEKGGLVRIWHWKCTD